MALSDPRPQESRPFGLSWRSGSPFVIATVGVGMLTDTTCYQIIVPVIPFLLQDLGYTPPEVQTYTSTLLAVFALSTCITAPFVAILSEHATNRRRPFLFGLACLGLSTALYFVARNVWLLCLGRMLQGASGAIIWTTGMGLVLETVGADSIGKAMGPVFAAASFGTLLAPPLGGTLFHHFGSIGVFCATMSLILVDFVMRLLLIEKSTRERYEAADKVQEDESGHGDEQTPLLSSTAPASDLAPSAGPDTTRPRSNEGVQENDNKDDEDLSEYIIDFDQQPWICRTYKALACCLASSRLMSAQVFAFTNAAILASLDSTVPIVAHEYFNFNSQAAGLLFIPILIFDVLLMPIGGILTDKYGPKRIAVVGLVSLAPSLVLLRLVHAGGQAQVILYVVLLSFIGASMSFMASASLVESGLVSVKFERANPTALQVNTAGIQMYSLSTVTYNSGLCLGPIIAASAKNLVGYGNMNLFFTLMALLAAAHCGLYMGGRPAWFRKYLDSRKSNR